MFKCSLFLHITRKSTTTTKKCCWQVKEHFQKTCILILYFKETFKTNFGSKTQEHLSGYCTKRLNSTWFYGKKWFYAKMTWLLLYINVSHLKKTWESAFYARNMLRIKLNEWMSWIIKIRVSYVVQSWNTHHIRSEYFTYSNTIF